MRKSNLRATAAWQALALVGAGFLAAQPAYAQSADEVVGDDGKVENADGTPAVATDQPAADEGQAIIVTGSRLVRPDLVAPSPVTSVDSEQFDLTGTVTVETLLNELPQLIPGNTRTSNNQGGEDFSTLDLRGLGPQRTLILVDGERVPASSTTGVVDIGTIPAGLIERVDVVTGGASAVYGSDAMAGVVNFILKDRYEGLEVSSQYGITQKGDGAQFNIQALLGGNFANDRGNMTFFTSYYTRDSISQADRDVTRNAGALYLTPDGNTVFVPDHLRPTSDYPTGTSLFQPAGSGTPPWGWITNNTGSPFGGPLLNVRPDISVARLNQLNTLLPGQFASADTDCNASTAGAPVRTGNLSFNDAGQLTPRFTGGLCAFADRSVGSSRYNFNPVNFLVTPYKRWNMALTARYDVTDDITLKVIGNYTDSEQTVNLAPTPATGLVVDPTTNPFIRLGVAGSAPCGIGVSCRPDLLTALNSRGYYTGDLTGAQRFTALDGFGDNPQTSAVETLSSCLRTSTGAVRNNTCTFVSAANAPFTIDRRFSETGPRIGIYDSKTATLRGTLNGNLTDRFKWDVTASYGRTDAVATLKNNINRTAFANGVAGCPTGSLPGCVPIDIFGPNTLFFEGPLDANNPLGSPFISSSDALSFLRVDTKETRTFDQVRLAGNITGSLVDLPAGPVAVAVGAEVRKDRGTVIVDDAQRTGNIYGFNATQDQKGSVNVKEVYGEVGIPILKEQPFFHELSIEAGARYSDYSTVGGLFNWKVGAQWAPVSWARVRGIYNRAARAPSVVELFQNGDQGFPAYSDPCNFNDPNLSQDVLDICQAQAPAVDFDGFLQNNAQVQAFAFGNPTLSEERATTWTVGAVLTPDLGLGRFSATIDYYNIKIKDVITTQGAGFYLGQCYTAFDAAACDRIVRDPVTGQITSIDTSIANLGYFKTTGVDAQINYAVPFNDLGLNSIPGRLRVQALVSWLDSIDFGDGFNFSGRTAGGIGGSFPEWKANTTIAYDTKSTTVQLRWNWQTDLEDVTFGEDSAADVPGLSYFDLSLRQAIGDNFEITGIVQNMFNQKARKTVAGFFAEGGTDVAYWNPVILGRTFTIQARVKL